MDDLAVLFKAQTNNRWNVSKTNYKERRVKLQSLKAELLRRREDIKLAMFNDFKKPYAESELTEIHPVLDELNFAIKHLKNWMKPKKVPTPIVLIGSRSELHYEARGVVLILSPWNYPFSLLLNPMIAAIASGNCVIARPSEKTPHTGKILKEIIDSVFSPSEIVLVLGEVNIAEELLELPFDHIFFTGSIAVGKKIMAAAANNLASVTLELGGKSPVIIDREVDLEMAVSRLAWGKYMNGGQTCVAPDYLFIPEELKEKFLNLFTEQIKKNYGETSSERLLNPDYARLIDSESFKRLTAKIQREKNLLDGEAFSDQNYIPPTVIETTLNNPIMEDEIFGPILPVLTYKKIDEVINHIRSGTKPLSLYIFSKQKDFIKYVLSSTTSGGAVINHVVLHLANPNLPFGGVGHSGQGSYHGHFGFKAFSHEKSVLIQGRFTLTSLYFPPYSTWLSKVSFKFLRLFE
ncbi:MAG: aldehyde dehydrogenase family protein [Bacteriovorax sp.]|nr:aldehyde dehydrogenase family protein [Bacteriovorax sp.]